jgi:hypothetical protein
VALLAAIGILAGASIAYEILLTRLFSILLWHHFAYMIISVALLGIGASGTFLAFAGRFLRRGSLWSLRAVQCCSQPRPSEDLP